MFTAAFVYCSHINLTVKYVYFSTFVISSVACFLLLLLILWEILSFPLVAEIAEWKSISPNSTTHQEGERIDLANYNLHILQ